MSRPLGRVQVSRNPCVDVYGPGPEEARCKTCALLLGVGGIPGSIRKCALRINTHGAKTDHRAGWLACAKYQEHQAVELDGSNTNAQEA